MRTRKQTARAQNKAQACLDARAAVELAHAPQHRAPQRARRLERGGGARRHCLVRRARRRRRRRRCAGAAAAIRRDGRRRRLALRVREQHRRQQRQVQLARQSGRDLIRRSGRARDLDRVRRVVRVKHGERQARHRDAAGGGGRCDLILLVRRRGRRRRRIAIAAIAHHVRCRRQAAVDQPQQRQLRQTFRVAAQNDVGAAPRHVGRDRDRAGQPGLRDDLRLDADVLGLGVEQLHARERLGLPPGLPAAEQRAQHAQHGLGLVDRGGADEQRAARGPAARDGARDLDVLVLNAIVVVYVDC